MKPLLPIVPLLALCMPAHAAVASPSLSLNPVCPPGLYTADPEARVMPDGRLYLYGSRDEPGTAWCSRSYNVMSTADMKTWWNDAMTFATDGPAKQTDYTSSVIYAPDCIFRNGKYYLYYCLASGGENEGVAVGDSPIGPFKAGKKIAGISGIDPAVFVDDDGQAYLYWGQSSASCATLTKDMTAIDRATIRHGIVVHRGSGYVEKPGAALAAREHWFNEGSSVRKRNGVYYYVYAQGGRHGRDCCSCLAYATADNPLGPFVYRGVIVDNFGSGPNLVNNHGSIAEFGGRWYVFYHRPTHATSSMRKVCVEPIAFNADGSIDEVPMTTQGAGGPMDPLVRMDAARACLMSGHVRVREHRPACDLVVERLDGIRSGDTATWRYFDFTGKNVAGFTCKTVGKTVPGTIGIHADKPDGELLGTCDVRADEPGTAFTRHTATINPVSGVHAVVFVFKAADPAATSDLFSLEWFRFETSGPTPESR